MRYFLKHRKMCLSRIRERGWKFYTFIGGAARFMFAWDTDLARIDEFCRDLKECAAQAQLRSYPLALSGRS
jgi:threonine aldolase